MLPALAYARRSWRVFGGADAYAIGGASPELVAAFTTASDGTTAGEYFRKASSETTFDGLFTFSRSGTATYFDSNGTLQTAADGVARTQAYRYNSGWELAGLQLESAAATNLLPYGVDFTNAAWSKFDVAVAVSSGDIYEITESGTGTQTPCILDSVTVTSGAVHCISIDIKDVDRGYAFLQWNDAINRFSINVDLSDGSVTDTDTVGTPGVVGYGAIDLGDGWYRLWISATPALTGGVLVVGLSDSATPSWTAAAITEYTISGKKIQVRYAQLEAGSIPTSYILTNGSTVTRAAETLSIAGADTPANTTAMSISMKGLMTYADNGAAAQETFLRWYADASNYITLDLDTDSTATGEVNANQSTAGTLDTVVAGAEYSPGVNVAFNIASRHTSGAVNVAKDGTAATADTTPTALADLSSTTLQLGYDFNGFISEFRMWGADIGDSGIAEVTS